MTPPVPTVELAVDFYSGFMVGIAMGFFLGVFAVAFFAPLGEAMAYGCQVLWRWFWRRRKRVAAAIGFSVVLLWTGSARAQIPVIDVEANPQHWPLQIANMIREVTTSIDQLQDMYKQAKGGNVPEADVSHILALFAQLAGDPNSILFGGSYQDWNEVYARDHIWENGEWLPSYIDRENRSIETQRILLEMVSAKMEQQEAEQAQIHNAVMTGRDAGGRNAILKAMHGALTGIMGRLDVAQALQVIEINSKTVDVGHRINDQMSKEAQERYFLIGRKKPERMQFANIGAY